MLEVKSFYTKQDIESCMLNSGQDFAMYPSLKELVQAENLKDYGQDFGDIYEYTDHLFKPENVVCYIVKGNIFPDDEYGINLIFINYSKDDIPTAIYIESPWAKGSEQISKMVEVSMLYIANTKGNKVLK